MLITTSVIITLSILLNVTDNVTPIIYSIDGISNQCKTDTFPSWESASPYYSTSTIETTSYYSTSTIESTSYYSTSTIESTSYYSTSTIESTSTSSILPLESRTGDKDQEVTDNRSTIQKYTPTIVASSGVLVAGIAGVIAYTMKRKTRDTSVADVEVSDQEPMQNLRVYS